MFWNSAWHAKTVYAQKRQLKDCREKLAEFDNVYWSRIAECTLK